MSEKKPTKVSIWQDVRVHWEFTTNVYGGFPAAVSVLDPFISKKIKDGRITSAVRVDVAETGRVEVRAEGLSIEELHARKIEEALETLPTEAELIEERTLVFRRWNGALAFWGGAIRAHIKECARVAAQHVMPAKVKGEKSLNVRAVNGLYLEDNWVTLMRDGVPLTKAEDQEEFFVHVRDPRTGAPMNSIKRCELVTPPVSVDFTLKVLAGIVTEQELDVIFQYGALHGFGQERSRGMGRYRYALEYNEK